MYDGKPGEAASTGGEDPTVVITAGGDEGSGVPRVSADDWILDAISREDRRSVHSSVSHSLYQPIPWGIGPLESILNA